MRVFLSWSGPRSKAAAEAFRNWLPDVLQRVEAWFSYQDIELGASWNQGIRNGLDESEFGILFITRENLEKPWMMYEAGAIAKHVGARVVPLIVDDELDPKALPGPIGQLQAIKFSKQTMKQLVTQLNERCDKKLEPERLARCFETNWPILSTKVDGLPEAEGKAPELAPDEMMKQMYAMMSNIRKQQGGSWKKPISMAPLDQKSDLSYGMFEITSNDFQNSLRILNEEFPMNEHDRQKLRNAFHELWVTKADATVVRVQSGGKEWKAIVLKNGHVEIEDAIIDDL